MKISRKGFTLAELLIVVAIIAVLVAVAIPVFGSQLEKSREAADLANVRAAYAKVLTEANMGIYNEPVTVKLKQKQYGLAVGGCNYNWGNQPFSKGRRYGELDWNTRSKWRMSDFV